MFYHDSEEEEEEEEGERGRKEGREEEVEGLPPKKVKCEYIQ